MMWSTASSKETPRSVLSNLFFSVAQEMAFMGKNLAQRVPFVFRSSQPTNCPTTVPT